MSAVALHLASRLARREVRRRPWRSLLVVLLVAVPVAGMTVAVVLARTNQPTNLERWRLSNGAADAVLLAGGSTRAAGGSTPCPTPACHRKAGW